jgi:hypothetical protein
LQQFFPPQSPLEIAFSPAWYASLAFGAKFQTPSPKQPFNPDAAVVKELFLFLPTHAAARLSKQLRSSPHSNVKAVTVLASRHLK